MSKLTNFFKSAMDLFSSRPNQQKNDIKLLSAMCRTCGRSIAFDSGEPMFYINFGTKTTMQLKIAQYVFARHQIPMEWHYDNDITDKDVLRIKESDVMKNVRIKEFLFDVTPDAGRKVKPEWLAAESAKIIDEMRSLGISNHIVKTM